MLDRDGTHVLLGTAGCSCLQGLQCAVPRGGGPTRPSVRHSVHKSTPFSPLRAVRYRFPEICEAYFNIIEMLKAPFNSRCVLHVQPI